MVDVEVDVEVEVVVVVVVVVVMLSCLPTHCITSTKFSCFDQ